MSGHASTLWSDEHKRWCCYKFAGEVGEIGSWMSCGNHWVQFHAIEPFFSLFFPDSESYSGYWLGFFTSNIREVLGATWLLFCLLRGRCLVPRLDLWLLFWVLFWEWKLQPTLDTKLNSFDSNFQDHSWQQKKKEEGSTNKFGGCKSGTPRKATVGWACSYDEMKGLQTGLQTLKAFHEKKWTLICLLCSREP